MIKTVTRVNEIDAAISQLTEITTSRKLYLYLWKQTEDKDSTKQKTVNKKVISNWVTVITVIIVVIQAHYQANNVCCIDGNNAVEMSIMLHSPW